MSKLKTYYVEIEGSNCLLTPKTKASHFAAGDTSKPADFIQILYIKEENETKAKESAIKLLEEDPILKSLVTNIKTDPITFKIEDIEDGFDEIPATKKILVASYFFYLKDEQFDEPEDIFNSEEELMTVPIKLDSANASYSKISKEAVFEKGIPVWNPVLANHIDNSIKVNWNENDAQLIHTLPEVIKNLYYLWWFNCEAGGSGISGYILQNNSHHIKGSYLALKAIGAKSLSNLLGHAIAMTIDNKGGEYCAEYCYSAPDLAWFKKFTDKATFKEIESIDNYENQHELMDQLDDFIIEYINENIEEIAA